MRERKIDLLSVGELLIDMMSADFADTMDEAELFKRLPGGSPANLCMNMKRLGNRVRLVATLGHDDMGDFLFRYVQKLGLSTDSIHQTEAANTTLILVTRSRQVSNFEAYRGADMFITDKQLPDELLGEVSIFHTTCFALSKQPARDTILRGAKKVVEMGGKLSIDANYAQKIWQNQAEAQATVAEFCAHGAFVKCSEVDWERLYGAQLTDYEAAAKHFLKLGAQEICVTMGGDGLFVASNTEGGILSRPDLLT
ncbi:MAG: carbohydrate kinase [Saprospiraceae bacterium]|nr:carbohydrate kinase [Saprospiraceae bacterium]